MKAYFQKPIDEEFNDSYSRSGLQPSVGSVQQFRKVEVDRGSAGRKIGTTAQVAGATTQVAGKALKTTGAAMKAAGKGMSTGGSALMRAGGAISGTGIGAIVGVPTIALGAGVKVMGVGTQVAGTATKAVGKTADKTGKGVRQAGGQIKKLSRNARISDKFERLTPQGRLSGGRMNSVPAQQLLRATKFVPGPVGRPAAVGLKATEELWERRKVTRANITIFSTGFSLWMGLQLPLVFFSLAFLAAGATIVSINAAVESVSKAVVGDTITYYLGAIGSFVLNGISAPFNWLFEKIFGFGFTEAFQPSNFFIATHYLIVLIGWSTLLIAAIIYLFFMISPFTGKGAAWKMGGFLISAFGYLIPGLNILPWFAVYAACVWKNPE